MKTCCTCRVEKSETEYGKNRAKRDGLDVRCKSCKAEASRLDRDENRRRYRLGLQVPSTEDKRCPKCSIVKPASQFCIGPERKDGLRAWCRDCEGVKNRALALKATRRNRENNLKSPPDIQERICIDCRKVLSSDHFRKDITTKTGIGSVCRSCRVSRYAALRAEVLTAYSDGRLACRCCGESTIEFLALDHIDGGGRQQKAELKKDGDSWLRWLKKNNYPSGLQILCHNCNMAKGFYGQCPHQKK